MKDITKRYTNGEVTIVWRPSICIHSTNCFKGLPQVFNPNKKPWANAEGASTEQIVNQINKCPSGALSYEMNSGGDRQSELLSGDIIVEPTPDGPLMVYGNLTVKGIDGTISRKNNATAFCRCGNSGNKPFCDGSHKKVGFKG